MILTGLPLYVLLVRHTSEDALGQRIVIEPGDAGLVIKADGTILLSFDPPDPDNLSRPALAVIGIAWALQDTEWRNALIEGAERQIADGNAAVITKD